MPPMPYTNPKIQATYYRAYAKQPQRIASTRAANKKWAKANRPHLAHLFAIRRLRKRSRLIWYDPQAVELMYWLAQTASIMFGKPYEVDHIVPINSPFVCGLHVPQNLDVLCRLQNRSKHNRTWPEMPNTSDPELKQLVKEYKHLTAPHAVTENPPHEEDLPAPKTP